MKLVVRVTEKCSLSVLTGVLIKLANFGTYKTVRNKRVSMLSGCP